MERGKGGGMTKKRKRTANIENDLEKKLADIFFDGMVVFYPFFIKKGKKYDIIGSFAKLTDGRYEGYLPKGKKLKYFKSLKEAKEWIYTKIAEQYDINEIEKYRKAFLDEVKKREQKIHREAQRKELLRWRASHQTIETKN